MSRQVVLDTETTGLDPAQGHRVIEVGCVELLDRRLSGRHFHCYLNPEREVETGAIEVHGISNEFLADKPLFAQIAADLLDFIGDADLVIHNAAFDLGFLDNELALLGEGYGRLQERCRVIDTLALARALHPGQKNRLDDLCRRYGVDNSQRELHGALLDAEILADVYLRMSGGQTALDLGGGQDAATMAGGEPGIRRLPAGRPPLVVRRASDEEALRHRERLAQIDKASGGQCLWLGIEGR